MLAGCAPFAHHGPWVRQGVSGDVLSAGGVSVAPSGGDNLADGFVLGVDGALRRDRSSHAISSCVHGFSEDRPRATHIMVGGGFGRSNDNPVYMLRFGITMEFYRKDARVR